MRQTLAFLAIAAVAGAVLAGCSDRPAPTDDLVAPPPALPLPVLKDDALEVTVPTDVVLIGLPAEAVAEVREGLAEPERVAHASIDYLRGLDPLAGELSPWVDGRPATPVPLVPTAEYRVHDMPAGFVAEFLERVQANAVEGESGIYDGNAVEHWLYNALPDAGVPLSEDRSAIVLVHAESLGSHAWRYSGNVGWMQPVRLFGEQHSLLVLDLSAQDDPGTATQAPYTDAVSASSAGRAAVEAVRDATHFRLLQGPIYPVATKPCHAVTLILGVRQGALTEPLPMFTDAEDAVAVERLQQNYRNLTGADNVFVDLEVLQLPQDDPVLDVLSRDRVELSAFRLWLDENWDQYWVPHEGCEPYVSFALYGDFTDAEALFSGIAMYDVRKSHRISYSIVSELTRMRAEWPGLAEPIDGFVATAREGRDPNEWFNRLFSHETGHLFGQRHPHDITTVGGGGGSDAFSSIWSTMSYQVRGVVDDFGQVDSNNFLRNRAGYVLQEARAAGLEGTPEYQQALGHLAAYEWQEAGDVLVPLLQQAPQE